MSFKFELINELDYIFSKKFRREWEKYYEVCVNKNVFMQPALKIAWLKTYIEIYNIEPIFIIAKKNDKTIFYPLVLWKKNWKNFFKRVIIPVGYSDFDYNEPYLINNLSVNEIDLFFKDLVNFTIKQKIKQDSIVIVGLRNSFFKSAIFLDNEFSCPFINLSKLNSFEEYTSSLPKKMRKDIRSRKNKLKQLGTLNIIDVKNEEDALKYLPDFLKMYKKRRPNAFIPIGLHRNLIHECFRNNLMILSLITLNNTPISFRIAFISENTYYSYLPVYDENYSRFSIGNIHRYYTIKKAFESNYYIYDLLKGNKKYKQKWANEEIILKSFNVITNSFRSKLIVKLESLKNILRNMYKLS